MRAFIIRPFGTQKEIDFDRVERDLIDPAFAELGIDGRTTIEILKAGNIRFDMFQRLLTADLVVADLSIHNANVFYELGIRHALRAKRTFLLRCEGEKYPFDLQTDRYFVYDKDNPAASLKPLTKALERTLASEDQDSPVFRSLPQMKQQDRSSFLAVPMDFVEEVERAEAGRHLGDLDLLAAEVRGFEWESEGLRVTGRAQLSIKAFEGARRTWEELRKLDPNDLEANTWLATIYQRLDDLVQSEQAVRRVLDNPDVVGRERAEALSLKARNAKTRWRGEWAGLPLDRRREEALRSPFLQDCFEAYAEAFDWDLSHFYPGLNALAMLRVSIELAAVLPEVWADGLDRPEDAERELGARKEQAGKLAVVVEASLRAARLQMERKGESDIWLEISEADLCCLTSNRPRRVADSYRKALADAPAFAVDAARSQLKIYRDLGILADNVDAVLGPAPAAAETPESPASEAKEPKRVLLFTGHMIDAPGREEPRFPPGKEDVAREAIRKAVAAELERPGGVAYGIAGGASGGDVLFHEVCAELGIPTRLYLALPKGDYIAASVQPAGPEWVERFNQLYQEHPETRVLARTEDLPRWLSEKTEPYSIWQRNNLWMLHNALADEGRNLTLIALWNGKEGDGPGGTRDLVEKVRERGAKVIHLNSGSLFGLPTS
jgi:hypothetical protein